MAAPSAAATATAISSGPSSITPPSTLTQRIRLIHPSTLEKHNTESSLWVVMKGRVYDVTDFAPDHPGGDDLILQYAGKDMGNIMEDPSEHSHSDSAFELLEEYFIGKLASTAEEKQASGESHGNPAYILPANDGIIIDADYQPDDTDVSGDFKKHQFLDLNRPLIMQVWNAKFSKEFYMRQVHSPRHLKEPARLFGPWYLEMFTRTSWYVVPLIWLPIATALFIRTATAFVNMTKTSNVDYQDLLARSAQAGQSIASIKVASLALTLPCFVFGIFVWTILEYTMHRFLFHIDDWLPDRPFFLMLHFLLHGIHHYVPMDRLRLVMPPILFFALSYPFTQLAHAIFPAAVANGVISGAFVMYVGYDCIHYALHHQRLPEYVRKLKAKHLGHHYSNPDKFFGVTSRFWDWVFETDK
ncbi:putative SCS7-required for hydroxylation of ceramide [Meira miltonrushii]|uniref:Putative SCS7-required for hydroxylation of ceramide n=1 Tax=Meira miltonrushii TaxID=1280837 RepID=A0A316VLT5_9BASI|nr:putative SCS7-required for hydroxylation of ceramide [Meira miltonrushii]PWN36525.1 putative SCS7-required for hydroxylation of ceramide [Meira miltonrushii]